MQTLELPTPQLDILGLILLGGLILVIPLVALFGLRVATGRQIDASSALLAVLFITPVIALALVWATSMFSPTIRFDGALRIRTGAYSTNLTTQELQAASLKVVRIRENLTDDFQLSYRQNGYAFSRTRIGWFALANSKRAFVWYSGQPYALSIALSSGDLVLVGFQDEAIAAKLVSEVGRLGPLGGRL